MPSDDTKNPRPISHRALTRRSALRASGKAKRTKVSLLDISLKGVKSPKLIKKDGRLRVTASLNEDGVQPRRQFERIPTTALNPRTIDRKLFLKDIPGHRPSGARTAFLPKLAKPTHQLRPSKGKGLDRGGSIFGADDRYLFQDNSFPWRTTGKVNTAGKWGSGTTIGPRHVLTASHVVNWTGGSRGGVAWINFTPGYFDGRGPWGVFAATRVIYWLQAPGTLTDEQTAFDYVVLVMEDRIGDMIGYPGYRTYDSDWNGGSYWQYTGYPGELSSGERPAFQGGCTISNAQDESLNGQSGLVLGHFNEFTPGQSGGCTWGWWDGEPWPRVVGVGSTIGDTTVKSTNVGTRGDNEYGGGPALSALIAYARSNYP
jgi:V8-like Glu-specific endopeptidase